MSRSAAQCLLVATFLCICSLNSATGSHAAPGSQLVVSLQQLREQVERLAGESGTQLLKLRPRPQRNTPVALLQSTDQTEICEPALEQIPSANIGTNVAACAAFLGTLFCFWQPHAVDRVLVPFGIDHSTHVELRHQHRRPAAVNNSFFLIAMPCVTLYRLLAGFWVGAAGSTCVFAIALARPSFKWCLGMLVFSTYVGYPICFYLISRGIVQGDGWVMSTSAPLAGLILHDLPSQQLRTSLFITAVVAATLADPLQIGFSALIATITTYGVLIKATMYTELSQKMQDSHVALCLATAILGFLATCRFLANTSTPYSVVQHNATVHLVTAAAFVGMLYCFWKPQAVDNLLVPFGIGHLDEVQLQSRHDRAAAATRVFVLCSGPWIALYHLSCGCWIAALCAATITGLVVFCRPSHKELLMATNAITFVFVPFGMVCVRVGLMQGNGWAICVAGPIVGGLIHDKPSHQLRFTLFFVVLFMVKGNLVQCAISAALMLATTALSIRTTSTLLQHELRDKLDRVKLEAAEHEIKCMRANLEGQREVVAQVAHMLHSPVAALDYQLRELATNMRLLNAEEPFIALFRENAEAIAVCMNLVMKISSQFTQHPERCAEMSLDNLQQHRQPEITLGECPASGGPADAPIQEESKSAFDRGLRWRSSKTSPKSPGVAPVCKESKKRCASELRPMHDGKIVVMLVDDVQCLREAQMLHLKRVSSQWDVKFEFREVPTGEECISQCISQVANRQCVPPHVIIMDQYMHDAGGDLLGSATVYQLRQNGFQGLIIGCSGNAECEQLFIDAGADHFWGKPGPPDSEISELLEHELCLIKIGNDTKLHTNKGNDNNSVQTNRAAWKHAQEVHDHHQKSVVQIIHDLGTPMQTLKLALEAGEYDAARAAVRCLARLRDILVNEAKVRFGKSLEAQTLPCRLSHMLEELELMMRCHVDSLGLKLVFETADALQRATIITDSTMLMSMMCNLISNAAKHSREHVLVQLYVVDQWLRIQVHDDGDGVPESFKGRLFQHFERFHPGGDNSGLGLTSVATHSAALGGKCGYDDSTFLSGAMFWFEVRFEACTAEAQATGSTKRSGVVELVSPSVGAAEKPFEDFVPYPVTDSSRLTDAVGQPLDVLLVDDSVALRNTMRMLLQQHGCTVSIAADGKAAVAQIQGRYNHQQAMFSVVLCDVQMGSSMGGYRMTSTLRDWESGLPLEAKPQQPVVLISGDPSDEAVQQGYEKGANAYVCKPVDLDELLRVLNDVVIHASSNGNKLATSAEQSAGGEVLRLDSTSHCPAAAAVKSPDLVPAVEFCDALQLMYGPGVEDLLNTLINEIQEGLAALQSKKAAEDAHKLKGLFGALYLKDAFDECELIHRLCQSKPDGNPEKIDLHIQNIVCLFDKSMAGQILPEKKRFFTERKH